MTVDETTLEEQPAPDAPKRSIAKRVVTIAVVVGILAVTYALVSRPTPGQRTTTDTSVTVIVSTADGKGQAQYPIKLLEGGDPAHEADHVFEALQGMDGVASATLDWSTGAVVLTVTLDPEQTSAQEVAQALAEAGYLDVPAQ